ncbi:MAG: AAA family ATPase, partial [Paraglaciecola polaris]|uniref:AAA family ATPase n=1 Tax=Paraglaciecola polaris TaxID=222814 RepID=UPI00300332EF
MKLTNYAQSYKLNHDQQKLFIELEAFLSSDDHPIFLLKGYAGVGKTYVTSVLTNYLTESNQQFMLMAPTGKAARVLSDKCKLSVSTIHGGIYSCVDTNIVEESHGEQSVRRQTKGFLKSSEHASDAVFIVDEASMVSDRSSNNNSLSFGSGHVLYDLMKYIDFKAYPKRKLILIGDAAQLPPVRMTTSPALSSDYLKRKFKVDVMEYELTQIVR